MSKNVAYMFSIVSRYDQRLRDEDMPHLSSIKQVIFMNILIVQILYQFPQILPHATQFCYNYAGDLCDCRVIIHMLQMFWGNISFVYKLIETGLEWLESSILFRDRNSFIFNHPRHVTEVTVGPIHFSRRSIFICCLQGLDLLS